MYNDDAHTRPRRRTRPLAPWLAARPAWL